MANNSSKAVTQGGSSARGSEESKGNNNNSNYGNYGNYCDYGQYKEKSNANNNYFGINDNSDEDKTSKMVSAIGMTDNYGSVNKSVAALGNMQDEGDNNYSGSFKPNNREAPRGFVNSEGCSFHFPHSHSNLHSQSLNSNNNTSYTVPTRGNDAYDHGLHRFYPMSIPFLEMQNVMMCQTSTEYNVKTLAQVAPTMFRKVLTGQSNINERIFVTQALQKVDVFNRIPGGERSNFYEREIPFRNIDLVHLVIDSCIQYFSEEICKIFNQNNIDKRDIIGFNNVNLQLLEISQEYMCDQGEHTQISWLHLIINVINKNVKTGHILSNFQKRKTSELEKPGSIKVLLSGDNKNVHNTPNHNLDNTEKKEENNLNIIYNNYENNNNNDKNNNSFNKSENGIDINSALKESECWFEHFCNACGGPTPECH